MRIAFPLCRTDRYRYLFPESTFYDTDPAGSKQGLTLATTGFITRA